MAVQRDRTLQIMDNMPEGIVITGPDRIVRFANAPMRGVFGDGLGRTCYDYLRDAAAPCPECRLDTVINEGKKQRWECPARDGRRYEVIAAPCLDADGTACQIAVFREVPGR
jgi:hypothetical protein